MAKILIIQAELMLSNTCRAALISGGHKVTLIQFEMEAYEYLIQQRQVPDIVIVNVQDPGSTEMVVLGAVNRLPHLEHTKVLAIGYRQRAAQQAARTWGADLVLPSPVSANTLLSAVQSLLAAQEPDAPAPTRIWWEGEEAVFLRWTEESLVFLWSNSMDTAVKVPRRAVLRLMKKGVLEVEGYAPTWVWGTPEPKRVMEAAPAVKAPPPPQPLTLPEEAPSPKLDKLSVITRLIRKLTGADSRPNESPSQA